MRMLPGWLNPALAIPAVHKTRPIPTRSDAPRRPTRRYLSLRLGFEVELVDNEDVGLLIGFIPLNSQRPASRRKTGKVTPLLLLQTHVQLLAGLSPLSKVADIPLDRRLSRRRDSNPCFARPTR